MPQSGDFKVNILRPEIKKQLSSQEPIGTKLVSGLFLFLTLTFFIACEDPSRPGIQTADLPSGWRLEEGRSQMLARSYPRFDWIALVLRLQGKPQRLFSTPYLSPPRAQNNFWFQQRKRQSPSPFGMQKKSPKSKKNERTIGFRFYYRSKHPASLELRLPLRTHSGVAHIYRYQWNIQQTHRRWKRHNFLYRDFRPVVESVSPRFLDPQQASHIEVWERGSTTKLTSLTLTLKGPFLYRQKKEKKKVVATKSRATTEPTMRSSPSSRPTRGKKRPTTRKTKAHPQPSSLPQK